MKLEQLKKLKEQKKFESEEHEVLAKQLDAHLENAELQQRIDVVISHIKTAKLTGESELHLSTYNHLDDKIVVALKDLGYTVQPLKIGDNIHQEITVISGW